MTGPAGDSLPAVLLKLAALDEREGDHFRQLRTALDDQQATVEQLADQLLPPATQPQARYDPIPAVQWWRLDEDERAEPIARIRSWVDHVFRLMYGHLAAQLGECWPAHPLALMTLDWLSELWSVLYLDTDRDTRTLTSQAEYSVRILPAAAAQLGAETGRCTLHVKHAPGRPS